MRGTIYQEYQFSNAIIYDWPLEEVYIHKIL